MALTRSTARDRLRAEYLDDSPNGKRWSETALNRALYAAAVGVLEECARHGIKRLRRTTTGTTTDGALAVPKNCSVHNVYANIGAAKIPLRSAEFAEITPAVNMSLTVEYTPSITEANADGDYLLNGPSDDLLIEWPALEEWILASAAITCMSKEPNPRVAGAERALAMFREQVLSSHSSPNWSNNPAPGWHAYEDLFRWGHNPVAGTVVISGVPR